MKKCRSPSPIGKTDSSSIFTMGKWGGGRGASDPLTLMHTYTIMPKKLREGNVFTHVCQSFCSQGRGSLYEVTSCLTAWSHVQSSGSLSLVSCSLRRDPWTGTPLDRDPPGQRPPGQRPPLVRDPSRQRPPWTETPPRQRPPWTETPGQRLPLDRDPPGQRPPWTETPLDRDPPSWTETPRDSPDRDLLNRDLPWSETLLARDRPWTKTPPHMVKSIPLECILVAFLTDEGPNL